MSERCEKDRKKIVRREELFEKEIFAEVHKKKIKV